MAKVLVLESKVTALARDKAALAAWRDVHRAQPAKDCGIAHLVAGS